MTTSIKRKSIRSKVATAAILISVAVSILLSVIAFFVYRSSVYNLAGDYYTMAEITSSAWVFSLIVAGVGIVIGLLGGLLIHSNVSKSIKFTLRRLLSADFAFSEGSRFKARDGDAQSTEDIAQLYAHFSDVYTAVQSLMSDVKNVADSHVAGIDDVFINEDKYSGGLKELAISVNNVVKDYHANFVELLQVMQKYGQGDFGANVSTYPGNWGWANKIVDDLRESFIYITREVHKIAQAAAKGNFSLTTEAGSQQGAWAGILKILNDLCTSIREPLLDVEHNVLLMSKGDFSDMEGNYHGKFKVLQDACNQANAKLHAHVNEIAFVLESMAQGNLTVELKKDYPGSYAPIKKALTTILSSLNGSIKEVMLTSEQILTGSADLLSSVQSLADGSTQQAIGIEQLNSSVAKIEEKIHFNSERAAEADELSRLSNDHAQVGNEKMQSMLTSMDDIKLSSDNISKIIKVIQGIAFQTNLLALNASVEAARAGVHGSGFAVVAEEVGNLASRSQKATKETSQLIAESIKSVDTGSSSAHLAASTLNAIVESAHQASELVSQIADISRQQAAAIDEITLGIGEISSVVQSSAATSEECAAIANEFNEQAKALMNLVGFYTIR
jgi:methyl-accepting chemotaxis protein